ncbi:LysE family transporter [Syntrophomonas erecta]
MRKLVQMGALFVTSFVVGLSGAMMPGPLLTYTIASSTERGASAGPLTVLGHALLELLVVVSLLAGASSFLSQRAVTSSIAIIGGFFLVFLGYNMVKEVRLDKIHLPSRQEAQAGKGRLMHPFPAGILVSLANPYWFVWWATVGLGYLTIAIQTGYQGVAAFFTGHIISDLIWYSFIAAVVAGGKRFLKPSLFRLILLLCGVFLGGLGIFFIYTGINKIIIT